MPGILISMVAIGIMMQLFMHIYFSNAVNSEDFNGIAGYDNQIEYNIPELKALLIRMNQHIGLISSAYIILLFISAYTNPKIIIFPGRMNGMNQLSILLVFMYFIEFTWTICYMNLKAQDRILKNQIDRKRAKAGNISSAIFLILVFAIVIETAVLSVMKNIENNSGEGLKAAGYIILFCIVASAGLLVEQSKIKKTDLINEKYKPSRFFIISTILSVVIMIVMACVL